jgi:hypothetical protein
MKTMFLALLVALVVMLPGCAGLTTQTQKIEAACTGSSTAIKVLTAANDAGKLSPAQQAEIKTAIDTISPICNADNPPTLDSVKQQAFEDAIALLEAKAKGVKP